MMEHGNGSTSNCSIFPWLEFLLKDVICTHCGSFKLVNCCLIVVWQVVCTKVREGDKRIVRLKEGSPDGRHVVIVDDLVQSGGTLIECQVQHVLLPYAKFFESRKMCSYAVLFPVNI